MAQGDSPQELTGLLAGFKREDLRYPGLVTQQFTSLPQGSDEKKLYRDEARIAKGVLGHIDESRQQREAAIHALCKGRPGARLEALKEIREGAAHMEAALDSILLRRRSSREFKRAGDDRYEQARIYRELAEQERHIVSTKEARIRRIRSQLAEEQAKQGRSAERGRAATPGGGKPMSDVAIFVSHSGADIAVAQALVGLLEAAFSLKPDQIRCTSVDGHRLPVGADTDEQLREEILSARAFIGIVSRASLNSVYVLFELGARWGAELRMAPVLAPGVTPGFLRGPLSGLNALALGERRQVLQLIGDLGRQLEIEPNRPEAYDKKLEELLTTPAVPEPPEERVAIATSLGVDGDDLASVAEAGAIHPPADFRPTPETRTSWHSCRELLPVCPPMATPYSFECRLEPHAGQDWRAGVISFHVEAPNGRFEPTLLFHLLGSDTGTDVCIYWSQPVVKRRLDLGEPDIRIPAGDAREISVVVRHSEVFLRAGHLAWESPIGPADMGTIHLGQWCDDGIANLSFHDLTCSRETGAMAEWLDRLVAATVAVSSRIGTTLKEEVHEASARISDAFAQVTGAHGEVLSRVRIHNELYRMGFTDAVVIEGAINLAHVQGIIERLPAADEGGHGCFRLV